MKFPNSNSIEKSATIFRLDHARSATSYTILNTTGIIIGILHCTIITASLKTWKELLFIEGQELLIHFSKNTFPKNQCVGVFGVGLGETLTQLEVNIFLQNAEALWHCSFQGMLAFYVLITALQIYQFFATKCFKEGGNGAQVFQGMFTWTSNNLMFFLQVRA